MGRGPKGRESQADAMLSMEPDAGLSLTTVKSRPELKPRVGGLADCTTPASREGKFNKVKCL